jgi:large subunit ribosomal protein L10
MNRTEKQQLVEELHEELKAAPHVVLIDFTGLSVPAATEFRRKVRAANSKYRVVKNRLARRAAKDTSLAKLDTHLVGTTGIAWTQDDPVAMAKALVDFAKEFPAVKFKAGVVAGQDILDADGVKTLSAMPTLPELRSTLLGLMQAPATKLVRLLGTPATQMARVLDARREKIDTE